MAALCVLSSWFLLANSLEQLVWFGFEPACEASVPEIHMQHLELASEQINNNRASDDVQWLHLRAQMKRLHQEEDDDGIHLSHSIGFGERAIESSQSLERPVERVELAGIE